MTATCVSAAGCATSVPMVFATAVLANAPRKLSTAAMMIANLAGSTRVEMLVATAFAVSWNPLVKSKASAMITVAMRKMRLLPTADEAALIAASGGKNAILGILEQH